MASGACDVCAKTTQFGRHIRHKHSGRWMLKAPKKSRTFKFSFTRDPYSRAMEQHHINGHEYDMMRVDERVPFGQTEIWTFENDNWFAHPVHVHGTHFRVLSRTGCGTRIRGPPCGRPSGSCCWKAAGSHPTRRPSRSTPAR